MPSPRLLLAAAASASLISLVTVTVRPADACSGSCLSRGYFVPAEGASVPANLPAIVWRPMSEEGPATPSQVTLTTTADPGTPLAFTSTPINNNRDFLLVPSQPLVAGTSYTLIDAGTCGTSVNGPRATFTATASAPMPVTLGMLTVTPEVQSTTSLATSQGSCSSEAVIASAAVEVVYSADAMPWRDVLHLDTIVDSSDWSPRASILSSHPPGASWVGRGRDRVYAVCASNDITVNGLPLGTHQVEMRATLPGTILSLTTASASFTLFCATNGDQFRDEVFGDEGGCCSTAGDAGAGAAPWLALGVVSSLLARRRRRR